MIYDNIRIYTVIEIMNELDTAIRNNDPFSLIRLGDGGLKLIHSILYNDTSQIRKISEKEGIPTSKFVDVLELWAYYLRRANFIDSCKVYLDGKFWSRLRTRQIPASKSTMEKIMTWGELYYNAEIDHKRFCNPELNYLSCLTHKKPNLIDIISNRSICFISTYDEKTLRKFVPICRKVDNIRIPQQYNKHYQRRYDYVISKLNRISNDYDLFLVSAGELGRIYSGVIKENGGRSFDLGFMVDYWCKKKGLHPRLKKYIIKCTDSNLEIRLTNTGYQYDKFI